jgi:hypothetical protein
MTPPSAVTLELLDVARRQRSRIMDELRQSVEPGLPREVLCQRTAHAVDAYGAALLETLSERADRLSAADTEWIRDQYLEWMVELATAACDLVGASGARHAVAQALQCAILLHEQRLRKVLEGTAVRRG